MDARADGGVNGETLGGVQHSGIVKDLGRPRMLRIAIKNSQVKSLLTNFISWLKRPENKFTKV